MFKPHLEILDDRRRGLLPSLLRLPRGGVLGGGTALAFYLGHRQSFDFDLFYAKPIPRSALLSLRKLFGRALTSVIVDTPDELTVSLHDEVKLTLLYFPFAPLHPKKRYSGLPALFDPRDLASNKAYAIGRRGTWRDYVDMHAWLVSGGTFASVISDAERRFDGAFSARLFLEQLVYTKDLGPFAVDFLDGHKATRSRIEKGLVAAVESYLLKAN